MTRHTDPADRCAGAGRVGAVAALDLAQALEALAVLDATSNAGSPTDAAAGAGVGTRALAHPRYPVMIDQVASSTAAMTATAATPSMATPSMATPPLAEEPASTATATRAARVATPPGGGLGRPRSVTATTTAAPTPGATSGPCADGTAAPSAGAAPEAGGRAVLRSRLCWVLTVVLTVVGTVDWVALVWVATSGTAHAADGVAAATSLSLAQVLANIRNWVMGMLASLAVLVWTVAGFRYLWSNGEPEEIAKAKAGFRSGAYGFALAALAPALVQVLKQVCGVS
jgi:hypothetical protein